MKWLRVACWALLLLPAALCYLLVRVSDVVGAAVRAWRGFFGFLYTIIVCNLLTAYSRAHTPKGPAERAHLNILLDKSRRARKGVR